MAVTGPLTRALCVASFHQDHGPYATLHRHPRDLRAFFDAAAHKYHIDWDETGEYEKAVLSASGIGKYFFPPFDSVFISRMIARSGTQKKYKDMTQAQILTLWERNRDLGTEMHAAIARSIDHTPFSEAEAAAPEIQQYQRMRRTWLEPRGLVNYRAEWLLYADTECRVAGTADLVLAYAEQPDPECLRLVILDHKRSVHKPDAKPRGRGRGPCATISNLDLSLYSIACNVYRWLIETHYRDLPFRGRVYPRARVEQMVLALYHPDMADYKILPCERLAEIGYIIRCAVREETAPVPAEPAQHAVAAEELAASAAAAKRGVKRLRFVEPVLAGGGAADFDLI